jgi:hypothetical protein
MLRASCGMVLRLPAAAIVDMVRVSWILVWHGAMHAAERSALPVAGRLADALDRMRSELALPDGIGARVAWADGIAARFVDELGLASREP